NGYRCARGSRQSAAVTRRIALVGCGLILVGAVSCRSKSDEAASLAPPTTEVDHAEPSVLTSAAPRRGSSLRPMVVGQTETSATSPIALPQNQELPATPLSETEQGASVRSLPVGQQQAYLLELLRNQEGLTDDVALR